MPRDVLVIGAGGFIGGHLVRRLAANGDRVVCADVKPRAEWWQHPALSIAATYDRLDAGDPDQLALLAAAEPTFDEVYNLAADMGGIGFIETNKVRCMLSVLTTTNVLRVAHTHGWRRVLYASSACVYPAHLQREANVAALREQDAYPADPEDGYGWEKLFGERMHRHFSEDYGLETRVARYHNVYGPHGTWTGGREKAPAALSRKVAEAVLTGSHVIDVWGDGEQSRSFTYVDDAIEGTIRLMRSDVREPLNVGSSELVTVNQVIRLLEVLAGQTVERRYVLDAPKGVRGRNSDNTLIRKHLDWEPMTPLSEGLVPTFEWVWRQVVEAHQPTSEHVEGTL